jgi:asparagine N-glycosylation enzyme membrane subunit Stt3
VARLDRSKAVEITFIAAFSAVVFALFFLYLGANGLILGNDSAVHLNTALYYLDAGKLSIGDIAWYTPLYHLIFDNLLAFTGVTDFTQMILLMKVFTSLVNWLVVFSVYVVAAKFLDKKTGVLAAAVMLLCTPLFQQNAWGGYTSLLSLAFMTLCLMYLALSLKGTGNTAVAFILSFCLVLSHQLATFLAVIIIAPVLFEIGRAHV